MIEASSVSMANFNAISSFLKQVLDFIFGVVGNYGWSVIIFTLLIRLLVLPLDIKSKKSMRKTQVLQPKLQVIQKKYANDKEKLNQKTQELYKAEGINPLAGCLPMLISMQGGSFPSVCKQWLVWLRAFAPGKIPWSAPLRRSHLLPFLLPRQGCRSIRHQKCSKMKSVP